MVHTGMARLGCGFYTRRHRWPGSLAEVGKLFNFCGQEFEAIQGKSCGFGGVAPAPVYLRVRRLGASISDSPQAECNMANTALFLLCFMYFTIFIVVFYFSWNISLYGPLMHYIFWLGFDRIYKHKIGIFLISEFISFSLIQRKQFQKITKRQPTAPKTAPSFSHN